MNTDRLTRWRLLLGGGEADGTEQELTGQLQQMDQTLQALYDSAQNRKGGLGNSSPTLNRWLGDIRKFFPSSVVQVMQRDALQRLGLERMLLEPELLEAVQADVHLIATLLSLKNIIPQQTKDTARKVVREVVEQLQKELELPFIQAIKGALNRSAKRRRPRSTEINWDLTIRKNLKHYQPEYQSIIPHQLVGYGRKGQKLKEIILCIDQSGSMATSVVYASVFGAVMASLPALKTHMVVFDTSVVDLTEHLQDPVDLLFGTNLGGGTDINQALAYCQSLVQKPRETILVLISDLYEGGNRQELQRRMLEIHRSGVSLIPLLSLSDDGKPAFDREMAQFLADLGTKPFACTPAKFPKIMAEAINQ